jgi:hypothetical protein
LKHFHTHTKRHTYTRHTPSSSQSSVWVPVVTIVCNRDCSALLCSHSMRASFSITASLRVRRRSFSVCVCVRVCVCMEKRVGCVLHVKCNVYMIDCKCTHTHTHTHTHASYLPLVPQTSALRPHWLAVALCAWLPLRGGPQTLEFPAGCAGAGMLATPPLCVCVFVCVRKCGYMREYG